MKIRFEKRLKRILDAMEKLGVAGLALAIFQNRTDYVWVAACALVLSIILAKED